MRIGIVEFPGSSGINDVRYVIKSILEQEVVDIWHKDDSLPEVDAIILPGGASYGDYLRPGILARHNKIVDGIINFSDDGGFVVGLGNGFQMLCEIGLLAGTLIENVSQKFISNNIFVKNENNKTAFSALMEPERVLCLPVASAFGRYYVDSENLKTMRLNDQILFRYCDKEGKITKDSNPNGSLENVAGICNAKKNVFGLMAHPERASDDELGNTDGRILFESLVKCFKTQQLHKN